jgi:hypothetical protein
MAICANSRTYQRRLPGTIETPMVTDMIDIGRLSVPDALANQRLAC